jgi:hypothetical protein
MKDKLKMREKFQNLPKIPLIIGGVFAVSLVVVIVTTIALKTELLHEEAKLVGKYTNRFEATFVGSETCKRCHERTYLEWQTSLHSRMMRDVESEPLANIGDFHSPSEVRTFTGSQWRQQYLKKEGDNLIVLPARYNVFKGEWKPYYPDEPAKRDWFKECAGCHVTGVDPEKKTFVDMGIACEACHGPGSNHVEAVPGFEIRTIINASRLTPAAQAQICGSCHTRGRDKTGKYAYPVEYQTHKGEANLKFYYNEASADNSYSEYFWPSGEWGGMRHLPQCAREQDRHCRQRGCVKSAPRHSLQNQAVRGSAMQKLSHHGSVPLGPPDSHLWQLRPLSHA